VGKNPEILFTSDGSPTLYHAGLDETYHSRHGAIQESQHVFIKAGLHHAIEKFKEIHILEIGFGTGLNALLSLVETEQHSKLKIHYTAIEPYPISPKLAEEYFSSAEQISENYFPIVRAIHERNEGIFFLHKHFELQRVACGFSEFKPDKKFHLVYHDAFAPRVQPELWNEEIFQRLSQIMIHEGIWVSYCAKGSVRRALQSAGFFCERLEGPPGKREMLRGTKT
jgi:tRNA U34 5-methylaminomethyl-2-thiouridine-forming methyltransferase MnmC